MAKLETEIPDDLEIGIQRLVDEGEFIDYDEAVREILSSGLTVYRTDNQTGDDEFRDEFDGGTNPSTEDEYVF